jgi:16S rRNA (cytosine1402-N4)-methyltransferase
MTRTDERHASVLFQPAIDFLRVRADGTYLDCTLGLGGHSEGIVRKLGPQGHLIAFDRDPEAMSLAKVRLARVVNEMGSEAPRITLVGEAFSNVAKHRSMDCLRILAPAASSSMRRTGDSVFRRMGPWT